MLRAGPQQNRNIKKGKKMKTNYHQLRTALTAVTMLVLLAGTIAHASYVYVSCYGNGTIEKFDSNGDGFTFASGLNHPYGLAVDSSGNLYVAEYNNGTIKRFDSNGSSSIFASVSYPEGPCV